MADAASSGTPSLSLRHGVRLQPDPAVPVEAVLLAVGDCVGHANLAYAWRMNKGVVVFVKEEKMVAELVASGVTVAGVYLQVSPLAAPSTRVTISGVPPFIPNEALGNELQRFGKLASGFRTVGLGCKSEKLKHVQSFRRQVFMFLSCQTQTLDVSFRVQHGEGSYMVDASTGSIKCFECGDVGHKRMACPHRQAGTEERRQPADARSAPAEERAAPAAPAGGSDPREGDASPGEPDAGAGEGCSGQTDSQVGGQTAQMVADDRLDVLDGTAGGEGGAAAGGKPGSEESGERCQEEEGSEPRGGQQGLLEGAAGGQEEEDMEEDSDCASVADSQGGDLYTLEEIDDFLCESFGKPVKVSDYFPDAGKFIKSVQTLQKVVGVDLLDEKKRFRLKKHVTNLRKSLNPKRVSGRLKPSK